jgi:preprotein translocase subunit YajC
MSELTDLLISFFVPFFIMFIVVFIATWFMLSRVRQDDYDRR